MLIGGIFKAPGPDTYSLDERAVDRDIFGATAQHGVVGAARGRRARTGTKVQPCCTVMETDHVHVTARCRPSHARGNAGNGQTALDLVIYPALSSFAVVVFLGWLLIISGIFQGISLLSAREVPHFWLQLVSVVLFIIVGALFLRNPGEGLLTLTLLVIVFFMVEGIAKVIFALTIRPLAHWGWVLASGVIGILLAFFLWANVPLTAVWFLGVLLGIELICEGVALGRLAWHARNS